MRDRTRERMARRRRQSGIALFMVLWVLILLSVMAGEFAVNVRTALRFSRNAMADLQAAFIARAGIHTAIAGLMDHYRPESGITPYGFPPGRELRLGKKMAPISLSGGTVILEIESEGGKININRAGLKGLDLLLRPLELEDAKRQQIIDSILDWRDADNLHRMSGAETHYYQSLSDPYPAKNGDFDTPAELLRVRGMTPEIYAAIESAVTVYPKSGGPAKAIIGNQTRDFDFEILDINSVGRFLLSAIPEMTPEDVEQILAFRRAKEIRTIGDIAPLVSEKAWSFIPSYLGIQRLHIYSIRATARLTPESPVQRTVETVVGIDPLDRDHYYRFLDWREPPMSAASPPA